MFVDIRPGLTNCALRIAAVQKVYVEAGEGELRRARMYKCAAEVHGARSYVYVFARSDKTYHGARQISSVYSSAPLHVFEYLDRTGNAAPLGHASKAAAAVLATPPFQNKTRPHHRVLSPEHRTRSAQ